MDDRAICLPWDKNFVLTPLGQTVVLHGELREIYWNLQENTEISLACRYPLGQTGVPLLNEIGHAGIESRFGYTHTFASQ